MNRWSGVALLLGFALPGCDRPPGSQGDVSLNDWLKVAYSAHGDALEFAVLYPLRLGPLGSAPGDHVSQSEGPDGVRYSGRNSWGDGFTLTYECRFPPDDMTLNGQGFRLEKGRLFLCARKGDELVVKQLALGESRSLAKLGVRVDSDPAIREFFSKFGAWPSGRN